MSIYLWVFIYLFPERHGSSEPEGNLWGTFPTRWQKMLWTRIFSNLNNIQNYWTCTLCFAHKYRNFIYFKFIWPYIIQIPLSTQPYSLSLSLQIKQVSSKLVNKKVSKLVNLNCRALIVKISCYLHGTEIRTFNINFCINKSKRSCKNTMKVMQILYTILYNVSIIICTMFWDYIYNIIFVFLVLCIGEHIELISFLPCNSFY